MDNYFDVVCIPLEGLPEHQLLGEAVTRFHRFSGVASCELAVSFPNHSNKSLGNIMRVHGTKENCRALLDSQWLGKGFERMVKLRNKGLSATIDLESHDEFQVVRRVRYKSVQKRIREQVSRGRMTEEEAKATFTKEPNHKVPHIMICSSEGGHKFALNVEHGDIVDTSIKGKRSSYGLSSTATVPVF